MGAAVLGGIVGGAAVLLGVILNEWLIRCRTRRDKVEELALALNLDTVQVFYALQSDGEDKSIVELNNRVGDRLGRIYLLARWPMRRRETIRIEAQSIIVRLTVATIEWEQHGPIADVALVRAIFGRELYTAIFGETLPLNERINAALQERGLMPPDSTAS